MLRKYKHVAIIQPSQKGDELPSLGFMTIYLSSLSPGMENDGLFLFVSTP